MSEWRITLDITSASYGPFGRRRWCIVHTKSGTDGDKPLIVIGTNPSGVTHTDENGNPLFSATARRLHRIADESARHDGHGAFNRLVIFNITPVATPSVKELKDVPEAVILMEHMENLKVISSVVRAYKLEDAPVLLCYGNAIRKIAKNKCKDLSAKIIDGIGSGSDVYRLGNRTKDGCPRHPLYCKDTLFQKDDGRS